MNVLSEPTLAVSEGHRPAHSRPADPTREYEPGSGASHDPAPVHRPYLARPPPLAVRGGPGRGARSLPVPPLRPQGCFASRWRPTALRAALDPGGLCGPAAGNPGTGPACPAPPGNPHGQGHHELGQWDRELPTAPAGCPQPDRTLRAARRRPGTADSKQARTTRNRAEEAAKA